MTSSTLAAELTRIRQISGFALACFADPATGMVIDSVQEDEGLSLPVVAAAACDVADTLALLAGRLAATGDLEDVIVTLGGHYLLIQPVLVPPGTQLLLLVVVDRRRVIMAMAHREVRDFCQELKVHLGSAAPGEPAAAGEQAVPEAGPRPGRGAK